MRKLAPVLFGRRDGGGVVVSWALDQFKGWALRELGVHVRYLFPLEGVFGGLD